jgi:hypothetical protein
MIKSIEEFNIYCVGKQVQFSTLSVKVESVDWIHGDDWFCETWRKHGCEMRLITQHSPNGTRNFKYK